MAKKTIAKIQTGVKKSMAKLIIPVKSKKTGYYSFDEKIVNVEEAKAILAKPVATR